MDTLTTFSPSSASACFCWVRLIGLDGREFCREWVDIRLWWKGRCWRMGRRRSSFGKYTRARNEWALYDQALGENGVYVELKGWGGTGSVEGGRWPVGHHDAITTLMLDDFQTREKSVDRQVPSRESDMTKTYQWNYSSYPISDSWKLYHPSLSPVRRTNAPAR